MLFRVLLASLALAGCSSVPEKIYKAAPETDKYNASVTWATAFAAIGVDKYQRLLPGVTKSSIIMADSEGYLQHLEKSTGKLLWKKKFESRFSGGPTVSGDLTLLGTQNAEVYALNTKDGKQKWKQQLSSEILSTPQVQNDVVIVQTNDGKIFGLNARSGKITWVYERSVPVLSLRGNSSPVIVDDQVFAGFASGRLVALALGDGKLQWESSIAVPKGRTELERMTDIDGPIVYEKGVLYVSAFHGQVAAIDASSGRILWTREMSSQLGVTLGKNLIFVTSADGRVWALNKDSGATLWMQDKLEELASTRPAPIGDKLVVGDVTGQLYWLSKADGRLLGHLPKTEAAELSGVTEYVDQFEESYFTPAQIETGITYRPEIIDNQILLTYQNGVLALVSVSN